MNATKKTKTPRRQITCTCPAYRFPHREASGECPGPEEANNDCRTCGGSGGGEGAWRCHSCGGSGQGRRAPADDPRDDYEPDYYPD